VLTILHFSLMFMNSRNQAKTVVFTILLYICYREIISPECMSISNIEDTRIIIPYMNNEKYYYNIKI